MKGFFDTLFSLHPCGNSQAAKKRHAQKAREKEKTKPQGVFVKTGVNTNTQKVADTSALNSVQKAQLAKKGMDFLEKGNTIMAHKIFRALKVYDGLMSVSKAYYLQGNMADAHGAAREAWSHRDVSQMTNSVSDALRMWLISHGLSFPYEQPSKENRHAVLEFYKNRH